MSKRLTCSSRGAFLMAWPARVKPSVIDAIMMTWVARRTISHRLLAFVWAGRRVVVGSCDARIVRAIDEATMATTEAKRVANSARTTMVATGELARAMMSTPKTDVVPADVFEPIVSVMFGLARLLAAPKVLWPTMLLLATMTYWLSLIRPALSTFVTTLFDDSIVFHVPGTTATGANPGGWLTMPTFVTLFRVLSIVAHVPGNGEDARPGGWTVSTPLVSMFVAARPCEIVTTASFVAVCACTVPPLR